MPREFGGPSEADRDFKAPEGPRAKSEFGSREVEKAVNNALREAQEHGNQVTPALVKALITIWDAKDPAAIQRLDPEDSRNQKHMSEQARKNLEEAWKLAE